MYITQKERDRLVAWEQDPKSPDVRIPIPADGYYWPSDECYWEEDLGLYYIDDGARKLCERNGFKFNFYGMSDG